MPVTCANCGAETVDVAGVCQICGEEKFSATRPPNVAERFAAAFAYFTFIPSVIFLLVGRFKTSSFVRFHCFQSIFVAAGSLIVGGVLGLCITFGLIPALFSALVLTIVSMACFFVWLVLVVKAFQGLGFKLPWLGGLAAKQARG